MAEPLFLHLEQIAPSVFNAQQVLLFSDFDGTLVPIKDTPSECYLDPIISKTLLTIANLPQVIVGVVSGRELSDVRSRVGLDRIYYAGNHGLEIEGPGISFVEHTAKSRSEELDELVEALSISLGVIPGVWVQHKRLSASIHYRQAARDAVSLVSDMVSRVTALAVQTNRFVLRNGKCVIEVRPAVDWNKGRAVCWLADHLTEKDHKPIKIYLGDDDTDEDAFKAWPTGITIRVGESQNTSANFFVPQPSDIRDFLTWLLQTIDPSQHLHTAFERK